MTLRSKRSYNNYFAPILTDLVRIDYIIIVGGMHKHVDYSSLWIKRLSQRLD